MEPGYRSKRSYTPRRCVACRSEASIAFQVLSRTVGLGQSQLRRRMKLSTTVLLCDKCSRERKIFIEPLGSAAHESLKHVRPPFTPPGPSLFDQA